MTPHEDKRPLVDRPDVHNAEREGHGPSGNAHWHTDVTFRKLPNLLIILPPITLPSTGGDTFWCSTDTAFDAQPVLDLAAVPEDSRSPNWTADARSPNKCIVGFKNPLIGS